MDWSSIECWSYQYHAQNCYAILSMDTPASSVNILSYQSLQELDHILDWLVHQKSIDRLLIRSDKEKGFIAGANIDDFSHIGDEALIEDYLALGQQVFAKLEALNTITIALIHGHCFGGGFELALACQFRIASDHTSTQLSLPELKLGLFPGWGGTVRLARVVDPWRAMTMILRSTSLSVQHALRLGVIDAKAPYHQLVAAGLQLSETKQNRPSLLGRLCALRLARQFFSMSVRKTLVKKGVLPHQWPAVYEYLNHWVCHGVASTGYQSELDRVAKLIKTPQAQALVRVFLLKQHLKVKETIQHPLKKIHVIGAGVMGCEIAMVSALSGSQVSLYDASLSSLEKAYLHIQSIWPKHSVVSMRDAILFDRNGDSIEGADLVIEAVPEKIDIKHQVLHQASKKAPPNAIIATNTSSIPLENLLAVVDRPEQLLGIHFFNPVHKMPLVELVSHEDSSSEALKASAMWIQSLGKLCLRVKSAPGFLVNRILIPYLLESMRMVDEGYERCLIDQAMRHYGMPMGPLRLCDEVGLDICMAVAEEFANHLHCSIPECLSHLVSRGHLGKKSGKGFYTYPKSKESNRLKESASLQWIQGRLELVLMNEAAYCLDQSIVSSADALDAGMLFGTGFSPFLGGPLYASKHKGFDHYKGIALHWQEQCGHLKVSEPLKAWLRGDL